MLLGLFLLVGCAVLVLTWDTDMSVCVTWGPKNKKPAGPLAPAGDENLVLANRYAHLIKRGAVPW